MRHSPHIRATVLVWALLMLSCAVPVVQVQLLVYGGLLLSPIAELLGIDDLMVVNHVNLVVAAVVLAGFFRTRRGLLVWLLAILALLILSIWAAFALDLPDRLDLPDAVPFMIVHTVAALPVLGVALWRARQDGVGVSPPSA